jgi:hypothetical protein
MPWTAENLAILEDAINSGVRSVRYADGSEMDYRTLTEMRSLRAEARAELAGKKPRAAVTRFVGSSGLR